MAVPHDTDNKHISESIAIHTGYAALHASFARELQGALDRAEQAEQRAEEAEKRAEAEKQRADKAEAEVEYWKKLAQTPKIVFRDNSKLENFTITKELREHYAEDLGVQGQQLPERISVG